MADKVKQTPNVQPDMADDEANATAAPDQNTAEDAVREEARDIQKGYEAARRELDDAVNRLRSEIQRLHLDESGARARAWIERNPTLATVAALGGGVLVGRLLKKAITPSPPPPLPVRARNKANLLAVQAGKIAHDLGDIISDQASDASKRASKASAVAAKEIRKRSERLSKEATKMSNTASKRGTEIFGDVAVRARQLSDELTHFAAEVGSDVGHRTEEFGKELSKRAGEFTKNVSHAAGDAAHSAEGAASDLSKSLKKQSKQLRKKSKKSADYTGTLLTAVKTAFAAVAVKRISDVMRKLS